MLKIPNDTKSFKQVNTSDILGNIWSSLNLDLTSKIGRILVSPRGMVVSNDVDLGNLKTAVAFRLLQDSAQKIWAIAGSHMFYNAGRPDQAFTEDAISGTPTVGVGSDMELFNGKLYVVGTAKIMKTDGSTWTEVGTNNGEASRTSCCVYAGRLYFARANSSIGSVSLADAVAVSSGTPNTINYTLNLTDFGAGGSLANTITCIRASSNRIWIATIDATSVNYSAGRSGKVFEWDGESNQAIKVHNLDSIGAMAMIIKDDIPYVVDADGKLLAFNGSSFKEVARLPVPVGMYLKNPTNVPCSSFIHNRGMALRNDRIQILINNQVDDSTGSIIENLPSGIWEYDQNIGLYHKQSISLWQSAVTTTRNDYAQNRVVETGALFSAKSTNNSSSLNGDMLWGCAYKTDNSTTRYGIFINDTKDTTSKIGYLVTPKIESQNISDTWQKVYAIHKKLLDSTDRIILKYRSSDTPATEGAITWVSTTQFTSTLDLSSYAIGDEVEITQGGASGQIEHITNISESSGIYTVTFTNAFTGATIGNDTAMARFQHWILLGEQTNQVLEFKEYAIGKATNWIQLKCVMYFTGKDEMNELVLVNKTQLPSV